MVKYMSYNYFIIYIIIFMQKLYIIKIIPDAKQIKL